MNSQTERSADRTCQTLRSPLEALFLEAADLEPDEQRVFIETHCADDADLAASLCALLASERASRGRESHQLARSGIESLRFGRYRVTARVGAGGMGVVYAALRDDAEYEKRVAIKAIPPGLFTADGAQGLRRERQILAQLEHPHIARLLDGGTTAEGVPWLAMEFVDGSPLLEYATNTALDTGGRLGLFLEICDAVAYAHRNLVVHSDIKPANILVTSEGSPKLLDFGIAKLLDARAEVTALQARPMTVDYASPEQKQGRRITTASDIYSLGLVLRELLEGAPAGDLQYVIAMALEEDPARRYVSVEQFAEDVRRYRNRLPVLARRGNGVYRIGKFAARHRVLLAGAALLAAILGAGSVSRWQNERSLARRLAAEKMLAESFLRDVPDLMASVPGTLAARQVVVRRATDYLDAISRETGGDRALEAEIAAGYDRMGSLTFEMPVSLALHRKALAINQALVATDGNNDRWRAQLAESYAYVANMLKDMSDTAGAVENARLAAEECRLLYERHPENPGYRVNMAENYEWLGALLAETGQLQEALRDHSEMVAMLEKSASREALMEGYVFLTRTLSEAGDYLRELEYSRKTVEIAEELARRDPENVVYRRDVWVARMRLGAADRDLGRMRASLEEFRIAAEIIGSLAAADPGDLGHKRGVAITYLAIAGVLAKLGEDAGATAMYARAIAISKTLLQRDPSKAETTKDLAQMECEAGALYRKNGNPAAARPLLESAVRRYTAAATADPANARIRKSLEACKAL